MKCAQERSHAQEEQKQRRVNLPLGKSGRQCLVKVQEEQPEAVRPKKALLLDKRSRL